MRPESVCGVYSFDGGPTIELYLVSDSRANMGRVASSVCLGSAILFKIITFKFLYHWTDNCYMVDSENNA